MPISIQAAYTGCMGTNKASAAMSCMPFTLPELDLARQYVVGIHDEGLYSKWQAF